MMPVFVGKDGLFEGYSPINAERWIHDGDASVRFRMIVVVALVLEHSRIAQDCKAMGEASWYEELAVIVFGQEAGYVLAVCGGTFAYVYGNVEDLSAHAPYELRLSKGWSLKVESAHHSIRGAGFVVLDEVYFGNFLIEFTF